MRAMLQHSFFNTENMLQHSFFNTENMLQHSFFNTENVVLNLSSLGGIQPVASSSGDAGEIVPWRIRTLEDIKPPHCLPNHGSHRGKH